MCISQSVGTNAANKQSDIRTIQLLLNFNIDRLTPLAPLKTDGCIGPATIQAITQFQRTVIGQANPTGRIEPGDPTLGQLRKAIPTVITAALLKALMPDATSAAITRYFHALIEGMTGNGINTPLRQAHFIAQVGHESSDFRYCEEIASGTAYEGRTDLGNTNPGDGPKFKGRGLIQITGRANYMSYGRDKGRDFINPPNYELIATDPEFAVDVACWFWTRHGLNALADADDVRAITKVINGGYNGLADRQARLDRAKCFLSIRA
ncbi:MAG: glycoside hydrolase family 19 protein [Bryobacteraceae bacterium]